MAQDGIHFLTCAPSFTRIIWALKCGNLLWKFHTSARAIMGACFIFLHVMMETNYHHRVQRRSVWFQLPFSLCSIFPISPRKLLAKTVANCEIFEWMALLLIIVEGKVWIDLLKPFIVHALLPQFALGNKCFPLQLSSSEVDFQFMSKRSIKREQLCGWGKMVQRDLNSWYGDFSFQISCSNIHTALLCMCDPQQSADTKCECENDNHSSSPAYFSSIYSCQ